MYSPMKFCYNHEIRWDTHRQTVFYSIENKLTASRPSQESNIVPIIVDIHLVNIINVKVCPFCFAYFYFSCNKCLLSILILNLYDFRSKNIFSLYVKSRRGSLPSVSVAFSLQEVCYWSWPFQTLLTNISWWLTISSELCKIHWLAFAEAVARCSQGMVTIVQYRVIPASELTVSQSSYWQLDIITYWSDATESEELPVSCWEGSRLRDSGLWSRSRRIPINRRPQPLPSIGLLRTFSVS